MLGFTIKVPEGMANEMHIRPVTIVTDHETGELVIDVFRYDGETIVMPMSAVTNASKKVTPPVPVQNIGVSVASVGNIRSPVPFPELSPKKENEERPGWKLMEKDIQRELGRYTEGFVDVQMISDTKAIAYIDDKDVPAAIGKGGKNVSAIVNKIGIGIDIKPRSEFDRHAGATAENRYGVQYRRRY